MRVVSNSSPLIYLARVGMLEKALVLFSDILIPETVYSEVVVEGKKSGRPEVVLIERLLTRGSIKQAPAETDLPFPTLHKGEREDISLALQHKIPHLLIDDKEGVEIAKIMGLTPWRTTAVLLSLLKKKVITKRQFAVLLEQLINAGYFLRAETFAALLHEAAHI